MSLELAADAFDDLSARHQRFSVQGNRRILTVVAAAAVVTVLVIVAAVDSSRNSAPKHYAAAVSSEKKASKHCDDNLGRRRFWVGPVIAGTDMCADHEATVSTVEVSESKKLRFLVVGDWGRDGMCCQRDVAWEMDAAVKKVAPAFVVSTGDNFYLNGIESSEDHQVDRSWRDVYVRPFPDLGKLQWKAVLGNHDYLGNVRAQKALGREEKLWGMPDQYFFETADDGDVFMAFIDTSILYYNETELKQFRGDSVTTFYRDNQIAALKNALEETKAKWKIVFGHHPLFSSSDNAVEEEQNLKQIRTILMHILRDNHVAAYFSGHEHTLEHLQSEGVNFFISGAGSKISPIRISLKESIFALDRQGFMVASFSEAMDALEVKVVDLSGKTVHSASISRPQG